MHRNTHACIDSGESCELTQDEIAIQKASARYYERRRRDREKDNRADMWIGIALYLIISGMALVAW